MSNVQKPRKIQRRDSLFPPDCIEDDVSYRDGGGRSVDVVMQGSAADDVIVDVEDNEPDVRVTL